jgi:RNA polymerase sporulation-specific sigma factor
VLGGVLRAGIVAALGAVKGMVKTMEEVLHQVLHQCSDEELIVRLRDGEEQITDFIMEKYKNLVRSKAKTMYLPGADSEDLIQEGMIGLFKAVRDYDSGRDASFFTFADLCISRQIYTAIQASRRHKHTPLNTYISLYGSAERGERNGEEAELINAIASGMERNPEELLIDKENVENLEKTIEKELSGFEKQVLDLYLIGMKYTEIAKVLGKDDKSTDNALQRIKIKLKRAFVT